MLTLINALALSLFVAIVTAILLPYITKFLNLKTLNISIKPEIVDKPKQPTNWQELEQWRMMNRMEFSEFWDKVFVYMMSFMAMFIAIYFPLTWHNGILESFLDLNTTRLNLDSIIYQESYANVSFIFAIIFYFPCWLLSNQISMLVSKIIFKYQHVSKKRFGAFMVLSMFFLAILIAGHVLFILNPSKSYLEALFLPFLFTLFSFVFMSPRR